MLLSLELIKEHEDRRSQKDPISFLSALFNYYLFIYIAPLQLQELLRNSQLPPEFLLPFDPRVKAGRILVSFVHLQTGNEHQTDTTVLACERMNEWQSA